MLLETMSDVNENTKSFKVLLNGQFLSQFYCGSKDPYPLHAELYVEDNENIIPLKSQRLHFAETRDIIEHTRLIYTATLQLI